MELYLAAVVVTCSRPQMFRWEELELLICGSPDLDFEALEEVIRRRQLLAPRLEHSIACFVRSNGLV